MNFVNNWSRPIELAAGADSLELDLPDGEYLLTLSDSATAPTRWENVRADAYDGYASLVRGAEGSEDQAWPEGSIIYQSLTAGQLAEMFGRIAALEASGGAAGAGWGENQYLSSPGVLTLADSAVRVSVFQQTGNVDSEFVIEITPPTTVGVRAIDIFSNGTATSNTLVFRSNGTPLYYGGFVGIEPESPAEWAFDEAAGELRVAMGFDFVFRVWVGTDDVDSDILPFVELQLVQQHRSLYG